MSSIAQATNSMVSAPTHLLDLSENFDRQGMTREGLITYLSTRLGSLDEQTDAILEREKGVGKARNAINEMRKLMTTLPTTTDKMHVFELTPEQAKAFLDGMHAQINNVALIDPDKAALMEADLSKAGQILAANDHKYTTAEIEASTEYLELTSKDLESGSQMDMIQLQSLMGARQTAIQMATNLISSFSESTKAIVTNIR